MLVAERFPLSGRSGGVAGSLVAPMPGAVVSRAATPGVPVAGAVLVALEAMKMEHRLVAHAPGVVKEVRVREGQMVDPDEVLVVVLTGDPE